MTHGPFDPALLDPLLELLDPQPAAMIAATPRSAALRMTFFSLTLFPICLLTQSLRRLSHGLIKAAPVSRDVCRPSFVVTARKIPATLLPRT